jgi:hypothetical protein
MNRQSPLADTGRVVVTLTMLVVALAFSAVIAQERSFVALGLQVLAVEFAAGRLAVPWTSAYRPVATASDVAASLARGALVALPVVAVSCLLGLASGARLELARVIGFGAVVGLVEIGIAAARDEVLLRGILRRGFAPLLSPLAYAALAALASAAWVYGLGEAHVAVLVREAAVALVAVQLWRLEDGAFAAIGFQLAFRFLEASFGGAQAKAPVLAAESAALVVAAFVLARRPGPDDLAEPHPRTLH